MFFIPRENVERNHCQVPKKLSIFIEVVHRTKAVRCKRVCKLPAGRCERVAEIRRF